MLECHLCILQECDYGYVPVREVWTACKKGLKKGQLAHYWTQDPNSFECQLPLAMVIGGIDNKHR